LGTYEFITPQGPQKYQIRCCDRIKHKCISAAHNIGLLLTYHAIKLIQDRHFKKRSQSSLRSPIENHSIPSPHPLFPGKRTAVGRVHGRPGVLADEVAVFPRSSFCVMSKPLALNHSAHWVWLVGDWAEP